MAPDLDLADGSTEANVIIGNGDNYIPFYHPEGFKKKRRKRIVYAILGLIVLLNLLILIGHTVSTIYNTPREKLASSGSQSSLTNGNRTSINKETTTISKHQQQQLVGSKLQVGWIANDKIKDCQGTDLKQTFPDIDYSLYGYNILFAYPMANGRDPGFTRPIFSTDFSEGKFTSDCRYTLPRGLTAAPDTSCVTSFSSTVIESSIEFEKTLSENSQLSVDAKVSAGGGFGPIKVEASFGMSYSANNGFQSSKSGLSSGKSKVIFSTAHCNYYFTKINLYELPAFSGEVFSWLLNFNDSIHNNASDSELEWQAFKFYSYFGTHFPEEVLYGARFTYEYKFRSSQSESLESLAKSESNKKEVSAGVSVSLGSLASASASFSTSGGYEKSENEKNAIKQFQESVETRTVSVGAPPPYNGDAMEWASTVKETPVPVRLSTAPIYLLFDKKYVDQQIPLELSREVHRVLSQSVAKYCISLANNNILVECQDKSLIRIADHEFIDSTLAMASIEVETECLEECFKRTTCFFASFGKSGCRLYPSDSGQSTGMHYIYPENRPTEQKAAVYILSNKLNYTLALGWLIFSTSSQKRLAYKLNKDNMEHLFNICEILCMNDPICTSFYLYNEDDYALNCQTYAERTQILSAPDRHIHDHIYLVSTGSKQVLSDKIQSKFILLPLIKLNFTSNSVLVNASNQDRCRRLCLEKGSCTAFVFREETNDCILSETTGNYTAEDDCVSICPHEDHLCKASDKLNNSGSLFPSSSCEYKNVTKSLQFTSGVFFNRDSQGFMVLNDTGFQIGCSGIRTAAASTVKDDDENSCFEYCKKSFNCEAVVSAIRDSVRKCYWLPKQSDAQRCLRYEKGSKLFIPGVIKQTEAIAEIAKTLLSDQPLL